MIDTVQLDKNLVNVYRISKIRVRFNGRLWLAIIPAFFKDLEKTYYDIYVKINDNFLYIGRRRIYNCSYKNLAFSLPKNWDKLWMSIVEKNQYLEAILIKSDEGQDKGVHNGK